MKNNHNINNIKKKLSLFDKLPIFFKSLFNKETPAMAKLLILLTFLYIVVPVDFIPAVAGPIGLLDDAVVLSLMTNLVVGMLPGAVIVDEANPDDLPDDLIEG
ncbi:DUF1232 domain-containing protein [Aerococcaceae bacterium DSM 111176]|nr:DUF1232 domain-containing protein [Aerococcaceae bacterium DSM 111176]